LSVNSRFSKLIISVFRLGVISAYTLRGLRSLKVELGFGLRGL